MESGTMAETREEAEARVAAEERGEDVGVAVGAGGLEGEHPDEQPDGIPPLELQGSGQQLSLKIAGKKPDAATAKMVGGKIAIPQGEYQPGEVIEVVVRMECVRVSVIHKKNNTTGEVTEVEREHQFKVRSLEKTG